MSDLPRQLADFDPLPGMIKEEYNDFRVDEIPLYPADGVGTHTYFLVEKAGLSTTQAIRDIARALNLRRHDIGFAGQKDARAVTRQWMSVEHVDPQRVTSLEIPRLRIVQTTRHHNKLRLGHLKGNAFVIKVRETVPDRLGELQDVLDRLVRRGVPNYFGQQRFGYRGDTWAVGRAIVRRDSDEAIDLMLGRPGPLDGGDVLRARRLYEQQAYAAAARAWPRLFHTERKMLRTLERNHGNRRRAFAAVDRSARNFFVAAYQSQLFNRAVAFRMPLGLHCLCDGDLAWIHASGSVFRVEEAAREQPRADAFEISPTGPLFGYRMTEPGGPAGQRETEILATEGLAPEVFRGGSLRVKGGRRPLRFQPEGPQVALGADDAGPYLELRFALPRGCYATALLRELFHLKRADGREAGSDPAEDPSP